MTLQSTSPQGSTQSCVRTFVVYNFVYYVDIMYVHLLCNAKNQIHALHGVKKEEVIFNLNCRVFLKNDSKFIHKTVCHKC